MKPTYQKKSFSRSKGTYKGATKGGGAHSGSTGKRGGDRGYDRDERPVLHDATCSQCGAACQVPFKPNGKKPVMCRDCFKKDSGGDARQYATRTPSAPSNAGVMDQLKMLNRKMDLVLHGLSDLGKQEGR